MVSPDSDLYRAHPDWCLHVDGRPRSEGRQQLILDYSRPCVQQYIIDTLSSTLGEVPISYIKWDMNRHMTEVGSAELPPERQRETAHRYMLGLYHVLETLTGRFPDILFESCSGGGGRFDPGLLHYMPQTWASDNSDAVSRLKIQYGTSIAYPVSSIGAHVSAVPNHQHHRVTSMEFRGYVSMSGNMGYELDVRKMSEEDKACVKKQIEAYKAIRRVALFGEQYRLKSPFEGNETAWVYVSEDKKEAVAFYFYVLAEANTRPGKLRLAGLDPARKYKIESTGEIFSGEYLLNVGLSTPAMSSGDFKGAMWSLKAL
jgi:alpha-galactosidase